MRLSMSRHTTWSAPAQVLASASAPASSASAPRPGNAWSLAARGCISPPFSKIRAGMPDHSTPPVTPAAADAPLIDIGINLTHDSYDDDRDAVITRARVAGVMQMVVTGATLAGSAQALSLARAHRGRLFATAGVHPHHAADLDAAALAELATLAGYPEVVAVGECGLDYFRDFSP